MGVGFGLAQRLAPQDPQPGCRWRGAVVVACTLVFFGFVEATKTGMFAVLTSDSGHLQVTSSRAEGAPDFYSRLIRDAAQVEAALLQELRDVQLRRVLEVPALISGETRARGALVVGMAHDDALGERFAREHLASGRLPAPGSWDEIALGKALARALQVELGDPVYVFAPGTEGWGAAAYPRGAVRLSPDVLRDSGRVPFP